MARVDARAALAGNPSDGYGGAVLAVTLGGLSAWAEIGDGAANELVTAAVRRFAARRPEAAEAAIHWRTSIPRGVGLGGSSAIVIATLRALCERYGEAIDDVELAELALAVEHDDLGIAAGLQDRIAQAFGGLTYMDFAHGRYERLGPGLLPPLVVAWRADMGGSSGHVHGDLRARFERGDRVVREGMEDLARLAAAARAALVEGDRRGFARAVDGSFDVRQRMLSLEPAHVEMVQTARQAGAAANYTGSGGAIVGVCRDERHADAVAGALGDLGCEHGVW
jgi:glucuronokinase